MIGPNPRLADLPLRPELVGEQPYGAPQLDVPVQLNTNENPYPPGPDVVEDMLAAVRGALAGVDRYPDREATALRRALASYLGHGLSEDNVWAANGSNEVMTHLCLAFAGPGRRILTFTPTYSMYPEYARNSHSEYATVPRDAGYAVDADAAVAALERLRPALVFVASPNNPTGTVTPLDRVERILDAAAAVDAVVVVDEAYQEFCRDQAQTALKLLPGHGNLVVCRTMSKAFAFAGGRLGYFAAAPAIVDACRIVRTPYHLSAQTQALAAVAVEHADELLSQVDVLREVRDDMLRRLPQLGVQVIDSDANFCLFGPFADRHDVWRRLLARGVLVREVGPDGWLRVSAGTPDEAEAFYDALRAVLEEG
jgi:histidinol-phosphate aminotransferase